MGQGQRQRFEPGCQRGQVAFHTSLKTGKGIVGLELQTLRQVSDAQIGGGELHHARVGQLVAHQNAEQRGFAAAVGANQADALTGVDGKGNIFKKGVQPEGL